MRKPAALLSLAIHAGAILLLFLLTFRPAAIPTAFKAAFSPLQFPLTKWKDSGGGGGKTLLRATKGDPPPPTVHKIWIPPTNVISVEHPKLVIEQALMDSDSTLHPMVIGDPSSLFAGSSPGTGLSGIGIGDRDGKGGIGPGEGSRVGGPGADRPYQRVTRRAELIYKEEPEYSEEARKARWQGTVELAIDIDTSGRPANIRVLHPLGLGLDEKAIAAVRKWRFRPAFSGDKAVTAPATVQVTFHLL
jgi:protein TonB